MIFKGGDMRNGSLIELPQIGKAMIITDIHGKLADYNRFMDIWNDFEDENNHLIITGDFIHSTTLQNDKSIEIVDDLKYRLKNSDNFHVLMGNHEWSVLTNKTIYKAGVNLSLNFELLLKERFKKGWQEKIEIYSNFFKDLPLAIKTKNKVFISHSGPSKYIKNINDVINIYNSDYRENKGLFDLLWNRYGKYSRKELEIFLENVGARVMIVGHTPVKGAKLVYNKQLIVSSSYSESKKAYVDLDLEKEIKNGKNVLKMVKYLD